MTACYKPAPLSSTACYTYKPAPLSGPICYSVTSQHPCQAPSVTVLQASTPVKPYLIQASTLSSPTCYSVIDITPVKPHLLLAITPVKPHLLLASTPVKALPVTLTSQHPCQALPVMLISQHPCQHPCQPAPLSSPTSYRPAPLSSPTSYRPAPLKSPTCYKPAPLSNPSCYKPAPLSKPSCHRPAPVTLTGQQPCQDPLLQASSPVTGQHSCRVRGTKLREQHDDQAEQANATVTIRKRLTDQFKQYRFQGADSDLRCHQPVAGAGRVWQQM